jgi:hypothetical protein
MTQHVFIGEEGEGRMAGRPKWIAANKTVKKV